MAVGSEALPFPFSSMRADNDIQPGAWIGTGKDDGSKT